MRYCDHLSSENASLSSQVAALDGHAVIFDGLGSRVEHLLADADTVDGARRGNYLRLAKEYDAKARACLAAARQP